MKEIGLTERLSDALAEDGDGDLLLQQSNREDRVLQWLQALDLQAIGVCRADERLKPLLKLNASTGLAEDRLLAHLTQHFEPAEVGMLARCFCMPLVSIRVGRINKQGTLICPAPTRYAIQWESKNLIAVSTAIQDWLTSRIAMELMKQGAMMAVLSTLLTALAWPAALLAATDFIDSKWTIALDRILQL